MAMTGQLHASAALPPWAPQWLGSWVDRRADLDSIGCPCRELNPNSSVAYTSGLQLTVREDILRGM
jgi:hypothetical protein